jgi:hypothetical protein
MTEKPAMTEKCASQFPVSIVTGVTADWRKKKQNGAFGHQSVALGGDLDMTLPKAPHPPLGPPPPSFECKQADGVSFANWRSY